MGVGLDTLQVAAARLSAAELRSCQAGESPALARLMTELVRVVHEADPSARNFRLNPSRTDQVLVYAPAAPGGDAWTVMTLLLALRLVYDRVAARLELVAVPAILADAVSAAIRTQSEKPFELPTASKKEMSAHLACLPSGRGLPETRSEWPNPDGLALVTNLRLRLLLSDRGSVLAALASAVSNEGPPSPSSEMEGAARALTALARLLYKHVGGPVPPGAVLTHQAGLAAYVAPVHTRAREFESRWRIGLASEVGNTVLAVVSNALVQFASDTAACRAEMRSAGVPPAAADAFMASCAALIESGPAALPESETLAADVLKIASECVRARYPGAAWLTELLAAGSVSEDDDDRAWASGELEVFDTYRAGILAKSRARLSREA